MEADDALTGFYVMLTGQVEACKIHGYDNVYCKYNYNYGRDWKYMNGLEYGISQIAQSTNSKKSVFTWNYPLDVTFQSTNPYGWPQLVLSVYGFNAFGRDVVRGYGFVHVPTTPGRHTRYIRLYIPRSSSTCQQIMSWLTGSPPEFFDSNFVAQGKGREVTRVSSSGTAKVVFNVLTKNMRAFGYSTNDAMTSAMYESIKQKQV